MQDLMQQTIMGKSVCNFRRKGDLLEVSKSKGYQSDSAASQMFLLIKTTVTPEEAILRPESTCYCSYYRHLKCYVLCVTNISNEACFCVF